MKDLKIENAIASLMLLGAAFGIGWLSLLTAPHIPGWLQLWLGIDVILCELGAFLALLI
jgi:hypothetical protein